MAKKKSSADPVKIISLDTETAGLGGDIRRIAIFDGEKVTYGYDFKDVEPKILEWYYRGYQVHIYIHNLEFDLRKLGNIFEKGNIIWGQTKQINGRFVVVKTKYYTFHDSFRILPESLSELSKSFDLEHGKLDLWEEVQKVTPNKYKDIEDYFINVPVDDPLYVKYLGYDVMSLYELIFKLMEISGLKQEEFISRISTASLSRYIFKKGYKGNMFVTDGKFESDYDILTQMTCWSSKKNLKDKEISYLDIENKIRSGYFGGRTEVFKPFTDNVNTSNKEELIKCLTEENKKIVAYHYDVNSLYPSVMIDNEFPIGFPQYIDFPILVKKNFEKWVEYREGLGFITCKVHIPKQKYPPLPIKREKLMFPCGVIEGTWTYNELQYAIENCGVSILEYKELIHFKKTYKVFHNFIKTFSELKSYAKENGLKALEKFAKLIMNTSYGYLMLNRDDKDCFVEFNEKNLEKYKENERILVENEELGYLRVKSIVIAESIQPQVGAYVTSYARLVLLKMLKEIEQNNGENYYCDTDSIVSSIKFPSNYVHKSKLGYWDLEGELYAGIFLQPKLYYENKKEKGEQKETIKFKGVSGKARKLLDLKFYLGVLEKLQNDVTDKITVERNREILRSIMYCQKVGRDLNETEISDKQLNLGAKQKRIIDYKNNTSEAYYFESEEEFELFSFRKNYKIYDDLGNTIDTCL